MADETQAAETAPTDGIRTVDEALLKLVGESLGTASNAIANALRAISIARATGHGVRIGIMIDPQGRVLMEQPLVIVAQAAQDNGAASDQATTSAEPAADAPAAEDQA